MVPQLRRENSLLLWNVFDLNTPVHTFVGHDDVVLEFQWRKQKEGEIRAGLSVLSPVLLSSAFHGSWLQCSCCHPLTLTFPWSGSSLLSCPCLLLFSPPKLQLFSTHFITVASEALPCCFHANKANPVNAEWVSGDSNCFLSPVSLFLNVSFRINCTNY